MEGTAAVIDRMQEIKHQSEFYEYIEENNFFHEVPRPPQLRPEEMARLLNHIFNSLRILEPFIQGREEESKGLNDLIMFVRTLAAYIPPQFAEEQFELLHPLRMWLCFLPISFLRRAREDRDVMILLAHFYAVALAVEPMFPAVGAAWFGSLAIGPIRAIHKNLVQEHQGMEESEKQRRWPIELMEFPLQVIRDFAIRMGWKRADEVAAEVAAEAYAAETYTAQEMHYPSSPSGSGSSEATAGGIAVRVGDGSVAFDITQLSGMQVEPLSSEDFYKGDLWRGWSSASSQSDSPGHNA